MAPFFAHSYFKDETVNSSVSIHNNRSFTVMFEY